MKSGDTFGDYKVVRLLGKGGMGEVWLLEGKSGRQVAAKILEGTADHESRKRFLREAQLALGVRHPNLVETYDVGEDPESGLCYILMEYVPGGTLADYIKANGALAIEDAVAVVEAIAGVLELGRQKGIVHRDIKPANIMFDAEGTPKLADLGIARAGAGAETTTVTQTGAMIGTPAYMSPEQMLDSHNVDTRADIYSLGVVFFEMLTGQRPNKDDTIVQLMAKAVKGEPLPDVRTLRPEVSASLAQLLSMMVAPDKDGRISTPGQITNALAIIERGGEFEGETSLPRQNKDAPTSIRARQDASPTGWGRTPAAPDSSPAGFPKWLIPALVLAALAGAFFFLAPRKERVKPSIAKTAVDVVVETNTIERVVERTSVVTNVVQFDERATARVKDGFYRWKGPEGEWTYRVRDGSASVGDGEGCAIYPKPTGHLTIPSSIRDIPVRSISKRAFQDCDGLTDVVISEGVVEMESDVFKNCTSLKTATLPKSMRRFGRWNFFGTPIRSLDLGRIDYWDGRIIGGMTNLVELKIDSFDGRFVRENGLLLSADGTRLLFAPRSGGKPAIPGGVTVLDVWSIRNRNVSVPKQIKRIEPMAFGNAHDLQSIRFESPDISIGRYAFHHAINLRQVTLPEGLEEIGACKVFSCCFSLQEIRFPRAIRKLGAEMFANCRSLRKVVFDGDAPELVDGERKFLGIDIFNGTPRDLVVYVKRGSRGWNPNGEGLPDRWPVGAGENARKIRYVDGAEHAGEPVVGQNLRMSAPAKELKWLVGEDRPQPVPPVRICFDQSHGGGINENGAFYLSFLSDEKGFSHKPCWYGFDSENLSHVNVVALPPSHNAIPYLPDERMALRAFMEKGGTVFAIVDGNECNMSISGSLLSEYGLAVVGRGRARDDADIRKAKVTCPALGDIRNIDYVQSTVAEVRTDKDAAEWSLLVAAADGAPLVACRPVGKGHLVYASAGLCFSKERMRDHAGTCRMWKRLFFSAAKERRISPKADLHPRDVLAAPCKLPVGPITLHYADRWEKDVKMIAGHVQKSLVALKQMGVPDITSEQVRFSNVALLGTGNIHWYWTGGKRQMVGILWGGSPERPGALIANLVENILNGPLWTPEEIPLRRYLGLLCLQKIGLESEFARLMPRAESTDTQEQFCRAFEAIRKDCPKFPNAFLAEWARVPNGTPSPIFFATLTRTIGRDCRPYFTREGISAFGLGEDAAEQDAWDGKLAFSDREISKMKGLQGDKAAQKAFDRLFPGWKVSGCVGVADEGWNRVGYVPELNGRRNLCCTLPGNSRKPVKFRKNFFVPQGDPKLFYSIRKTPYADAGFKFEILVDGKIVNERRIDDGDWVDESFDLSAWKGKKIQLEIRQSKLPDLKNARATWFRLEVK